MAEAGVPVGAGVRRRRAFYCGWRVAKVAYGHGGAACGMGRDLKAWGAAGGVGGGGSRWQPRPQPQGGGWGEGGSRWMAWARALLRLVRGRGWSWPRRRCWRRGGAILRHLSASGRMRRDTLLSLGRLEHCPPFPPPLTISPGARPIISGMHGCGGWLGLVLYIGPGWGYGGGPRRGVGRCGLPLLK
eukprot:scaffold7141_cov107-Isochrysis_galbana.AAC.2